MRCCVLLVCLGACVGSTSTICATGKVCPEEKACDDQHGLCVFPDQLTACAGLTADAPCTFSGGMSGTCRDGVCLKPGCGDAQVTGSEQCDGLLASTDDDCTEHSYYAGGKVTCTDQCTFDTSGCTGYCGDGMLNGDELCDPGSEIASPADDLLDGKTCKSFGYYGNELPKCTAACTFDTTDCSGFCGDKTKNGAEECDTTIPAGTDCKTLGFYNAAGLACTTGCRFDTSQCTGFCGDNMVNGTELCDKSQLANKNCTDFGFYDTDPALLACSDACTFDVSACKGYCGDRTTDTGFETCDGDTPTTSCVDLGGDFGGIRCSSACAPDLADCRAPFRQTWQAMGGPPLVVTRDIWGTASNNIYAVGCSGSPCVGAVAQFDGTNWSVRQFPGTQTFQDVWGTSSNDVFVVGDGGTIAHYNGTWSTQTPTSQNLASVWGSASNDVYAVGDNDTILHFTTTWAPVTGLPSFPAGNQISGVWGSGPQDVFVVGAPQGIGGPSLILHYAASTWSIMAVPSTATSYLRGVHGSGPNNVFAYGLASEVLRYDGTAWRALDPGTSSTESFSDAWSSGGNDLYLVGSSVLHYNGKAWTTLDSGVSPPNFVGVWGASPDAIFAATLNGELRRFGAEGWSIAVPNPASAPSIQLRAIWSSSPTRFVAVGASGRVIEDFANATQPAAIGATTLNGVGGNANEVFAVGFGGSIFRKPTSGAWASMTSPISTTLNAVSSSGTGSAIAVGDQGKIVQLTGSTWSTMTSPVTDPLRGVWAASATEAFAVGAAGRVLHMVGTTWSTMTAPNQSYFAVWGSSPTDVFAVGDSGVIIHYNGVSWTQQDSHTTTTLFGIGGRGPGNAYAAGSGGTILHYDGLAWAETRTGAVETFIAASGTFVATFDQFVYDWRRGYTTTETNCTDGRDDDCDGRYDCGDADCAGNATCTAGGACTGAAPLACNATTSGSTDGQARLLSQYACDPKFEFGRETVRKIVPASSGTVTLTLSSQVDLDIVVLATGPGGTCELRNPGCIAASSARDATLPDVENVSFAAIGGQTYYVVVDGFGSASGPFSLMTTCP